MKTILTLALLWAAITVQAQQPDTLTLVVLNTARNFIVTAADFAGNIIEVGGMQVRLIGGRINEAGNVIISSFSRRSL